MMPSCLRDKLEVLIVSTLTTISAFASAAHAQSELCRVGPLKLLDAGSFIGEANFGYQVAVGEGLLAVSEDYPNEQTNGIAVFREVEGEWHHSFTIQEPEGLQFFGKRISIANGRIFTYDTWAVQSNGGGSGSVFVYTQNGDAWILERRIDLPDSGGDSLPSDLDVDWPNLIVSRGDVAFIYQNRPVNRWVLLEQLNRPSSQTGARLPGDFAVISDQFAGFLIDGGTTDTVPDYDFELWRLSGNSWEKFDTGEAGQHATLALDGARMAMTRLGSNVPLIRFWNGEQWISQVAEPVGWLGSAGFADSDLSFPYFSVSSQQGRLAVYEFSEVSNRWNVMLNTGDGGLLRFGRTVSMTGRQIAVGTSDRLGHIGTFTIECRFCPADLDQDLQYSIGDVQLYLSLLQFGIPDADWDGNGSINFFDLTAFLDDYASGCE